jgi:rubrerythrin
MDLNDVTIGLIWPDELAAFKIEYERPENNAKDLGSASSSGWASYTKPVIFRCAVYDEHPRFAYIQRGAEKPSKCPVCHNPMKEIKK